ncbi:MAG TPA: NAD-dependent epimerase/dehydratase family protein [Vicinamibacterales bacterium]|nr:NAD-dependent epimerase/dehydratase family protein [Vicinamibacterales bacterium]
MPTALPRSISGVRQLDDLLSDPPDYVIDALRNLDGDILVLGVAGKMGPTLARMAKRATERANTPRRVIGAARFSDPSQQRMLEEAGVETLRCDLLDEADIERLPDAPNVVFMAGRKFGSTGLESLTWAMNTYVPAVVARRFENSRIAVFSTGNVYGLTAVGRGGSKEADPPKPIGEYAMSCLGRERMFEYFSSVLETRVSILRLNYAVEMRYGILADLARRVAAGETIDLAMGYFNAIWQADANAMALASLSHAASPPIVLNIAGPEELSVRAVCTDLAALLGRSVAFSGQEAPDALLSNGERGWSLFGRPTVGVSLLIEWTADWVRRGGATLGKPTHFESRDGSF